MDKPRNENEPYFNVEVNNKTYEMNRQNATLWTFLGRQALDHIWLEDHIDEDNVAVGTRFWREVFQDDSVFNRLAVFMVDQQYEAHISMRGVPDGDLEAYIDFSTSNIEGSDTPDWLPEV